MKLINNQVFNYQTDFNSFFKAEKNFKLCIQIFLLVSSLVIAIAVSSKVQKLLFEYVFRFFVPFKIYDYITDWWKGFLITGKEEYFDNFQNPFTNYRRYIYGAILIFTIEKVRLFLKYRRAIKKWGKFSLSYGIYEHKEFLKVKRELLRTLGNVLAFGITLFVFCSAILFAIYKDLVKDFNFENNFIFEGVIFSFFFWIAFVVFYCLNIYQRTHNYYRNYLKKNKIDQKKDAFVVIKSLVWHYLLNLFGLAMIALNIPIDLFIILMGLKFLPWNNIALKTKRLFVTNKEELIYSTSRKTLLSIV
ncbi:hypothetical protein DNK47_00235 [Mycoplasma wenyonii]|uniref:Uncharacterized protein n=1 Tax=Mycoplasma wenyonii TaxID=65123 RepID=A0A328PQ37_9MOLU|nr:hypothetical protein [Mycoplasma wenyonii]RAO95276.1 hypothetical protein DNK47_00235 [Mycoplasma wenyonii]